jgi:hypothetical protein
MPKALQYALVVLSVAAFAFSTTARAGPVTKADFAGKKTCWSNGAVATYGKDGSFDCNRCGHGTWRLVGDTLTENSPSGAYVWKTTKDGGTIHMSLQSGNYELQGSYCK